jgi:hypothetical protein
MIIINQSVVSGFNGFNVPSYYYSVIPQPAATACLSNAEQAPLVNRQPQHEPWPRTLLGDTPGANDANDESLRNTKQNPQYNNDGTFEGSFPIGRVEGTVTIQRGNLWRR